MKKIILFFMMIICFITYSYSYSFQWSISNAGSIQSIKNIKTNLPLLVQKEVNNAVSHFIFFLDNKYKSPLLKSKKILLIIKKTNVSPLMKNVLIYLEQKLIWYLKLYKKQVYSYYRINWVVYK